MVTKAIHRQHRIQRKLNLYPFKRQVLIVGAAIAIIIATLLLDPFAGVFIICLAIIIGQSWRVDMLPIISFVLAYQWIAITAGYFFQSVYGYYPGIGKNVDLHQTILIAILGLFGLLVGIRIALRLFSKHLLRVTAGQIQTFNIQRTFALTVVAFAIFYVYDISPANIWFGGSQIINNLLSLRFIPYFILILTVFRIRHGYQYAFIATIIAILPELLTGYSRFKEILFVVLLVILAQWRPWIKTHRQQRWNNTIVAVITVGGILLVLLGLLWTGGLKHEWRNIVWQQEVSGSPIERMILFFDVADRTSRDIDFELATEELASRLSSSTFYFSRVINRIPDLIPYERGALFVKAIKNAVTPRFLFPEKVNLGGDSWLVRKYAGVYVAGEESGTSVGLGYMAEFYVDYGLLGVTLFCIFYGLCVGMIIVLFAYVAPYKDIFLSMTIGLLVGFFMSFDGSFIKLFAGLLQKGIIFAFIMFLFSGALAKFLGAGRKNNV